MPLETDLQPLIPIEAPAEDTPELDLSRELLPRLNEEDERELAGLILSDYRAAILDRTEWEQNLAAWENQYHGILPTKTEPWEGCANFNVPLTMLGIETLKPRLIESVLGEDPMVRAIPTEATDEETAERTERFLNWQLRNDMEGLEGQVEESAHLFLNPGIVVAKILQDQDRRQKKYIRTFAPATDMGTIFRAIFGQEIPATMEKQDRLEWAGHVKDADGLERDFRLKFQFLPDAIKVLVEQSSILYEGPRIHLLAPEDFVAPFKGGGDPQRLPWCSQRLWLTEDQLRRKAESGRFYKDAVKDLLEPAPTGDEAGQTDQAIKDVRARTEGVTPDPATDVTLDQYEFIECYRRWDMDEDGFEEEIVVWISPHLEGRIFGWDYLDNIYATGRRPFRFGRYLSQPQRLYGLSFPEVIRDIQDEINTIHNQRVDAGTIQNMPGGFFRAGMTMPPDRFRTRPGEWVPLQVEDLRRDLMYHQWNGTPIFGQNEESLLYQYFERLTGITDLALGRQPNRVGATRTASGTAALLSEAGLRFKTSMEAFQRFWVGIFEDVLALDQQYLPPGKEFRVTGRVPEIIRIETREQIAGKYALRLSATTETMNKAVLREDATAKLNAALQSPIPLQVGVIGVKGLYRLFRQYFRAYGESDPDMILEPVGQNIVHTPEEELRIWASGGDVKPTMMENIPVHLEVHMSQAQNPVVQRELGPEGMAKLHAHMSQTMQNAQMQALVNQMQQKGGGREAGSQSPTAGSQAANAQTGRNAPQGQPQAPGGFGGGGMMGGG